MCDRSGVSSACAMCWKGACARPPTAANVAVSLNPRRERPLVLGKDIFAANGVE